MYHLLFSCTSMNRVNLEELLENSHSSRSIMWTASLLRGGISNLGLNCLYLLEESGCVFFRTCKNLTAFFSELLSDLRHLSKDKKFYVLRFFSILDFFVLQIAVLGWTLTSRGLRFLSCYHIFYAVHRNTRM